MAERTRYPQIPSTVWWGIRGILQKTPNVTIDERLLGVQLNVQEAATKAYINELRNVGILTEDGKATAIAQKWRLDESYGEAVNQIVEANYPEGLLHLAPPGDADRQKVVSWFMREGLGQGAAGNKAATYLLISSPTPNEAARANAKPSPPDGVSKARTQSQSSNASRVARDKAGETATRREGTRDSMGGQRASSDFPLNINVQIHISADAGSEQIESIFRAMRRYLYDAADS